MSPSQNLYVSVFFRVCQNVFLHFFLRLPRKYLNFTIKENMRGERAKDETFRNVFFPNFSYYLVTANLKLKLGPCQEEIFHLELG